MKIENVTDDIIVEETRIISTSSYVLSCWKRYDGDMLSGSNPTLYQYIDGIKYGKYTSYPSGCDLPSGKERTKFVWDHYKKLEDEAREIIKKSQLYQEALKKGSNFIESNGDISFIVYR